MWGECCVTESHNTLEKTSTHAHVSKSHTQIFFEQTLIDGQKKINLKNKNYFLFKILRFEEILPHALQCTIDWEHLLPTKKKKRLH